MKGNITKGTSVNRRWLVLLAMLAILLFVIISMRGCVDSNQHRRTRELPDIVFDDSDGYAPQSQSGTIDIPATTGIVLQSESHFQDIAFYNPESNPCAFLITVYLSDGTIIYQSDLLYPGASLDSIELSKALQQGTYTNALLVYVCYSLGDAPEPMTRCELPIEIKCI